MNDTAAIILAQLSPHGQRGLRTMLGAGPFLSTQSSVRFRFRGSTKVNHAEIHLNGSDTYDLVIGRVGGDPPFTVVSEHKDIYAEDLRRIFEEATGLTTAIPRIVAAS